MSHRFAPAFAAMLLALSGLTILGTSATPAAAASSRPCTPAAVSVSVSTPHLIYAPRSPIPFAFSLRNHTTRACSFTTGPFSPSFTLTNSSGTTVWASCWYGGGPAPCAFYLVHRTLAAHATFKSSATWDQETGHPDVQVPLGLYRISVKYNGIAAIARTSFKIAGSAGITSVTAADNGRHYTLVVGSQLRVTLVSSGIYIWTAPVSSNPTVLAALSATPVAGSTVFTALSPGTVQVSATENPSCYPQCLPPSRLFAITVTVIS